MRKHAPLTMVRIPDQDSGSSRTQGHCSKMFGSAIGTGLGTLIGNALVPGVGGAVGSSLGSHLGDNCDGN